MEPINLDEVKSGFLGKSYNALVQYHIKRQSAQKLAVAIEGHEGNAAPWYHKLLGRVL